MKHFILMADIKDSRQKNSHLLMLTFKVLVAHLNTTNKKYLLSPITITLGDEFQCVVNNLKNSISLIIEFEETIVKAGYDFKLRYVLHYGEIDTPINKKIAYEMLGPGLSEARERLNKIKKSDSRFLIETYDGKKDGLLNNSFMVYQSFVDDWRDKDHNIVKSFLEHFDYKEVSSIIKINPSSAWRREKSLKIKQYFAIKDLIMNLSN